MPYKNGRRVIITSGMFKGRKATVKTYIRKQGYLLYELQVDNYRYPFMARSSSVKSIRR